MPAALAAGYRASGPDAYGMAPERRLSDGTGVPCRCCLGSVANQPLIALLKSVGERHNASPAQVALAWLMAQKPWIVPLFGTRRLERLDENLGSLEVTLTSADLDEIDAVSKSITVAGARYPAENLRQVGL